MVRSFLMGLVGGQRAMTPLAAVSVGMATGRVDAGGIGRWLGHPAVAAGTVLLAIGEMAGDKQRTAPDRVVPVRLAARFGTSAIAGALLARNGRRWIGAVVGGTTAVAASYPGWRLRLASMRRFGQVATGLVEDAAVVAGAALVLRDAARR